MAPPGANLALRSPHLRAGASAWSSATSDPTASTLQPRPVPYARFFGTCPLPSHGVICLLSPRFQSPTGHPPCYYRHPFCPLSLLSSLFTSPRVVFLRGLRRRRCCRVRGQGRLPGEPSVHLCPLPGGAGRKFPPRPFPSDRTRLRPRPGRRREGLPDSRAPSPDRELARSVCL